MATPPHKPTGPAGTPPRPLAAKAPPPDSGDEAAVEQLAASELDELTHAEFRLLYGEAARNILFAKRQPWHMLDSFTLLALALVGLGNPMPFATDGRPFVPRFLPLLPFI